MTGSSKGETGGAQGAAATGASQEARLPFSIGRLIAIGLGLALVLLVLSWGLTYAFAQNLLQPSPAPRRFVPTANPTVSVSLPLPAHLSGAEVSIDGRDFGAQIKPNKTGFVLKTPRLQEGRHIAEVTLRYHYILKRKIRKVWSFTTDTVPPKVALDGYLNIVGVRKPFLTGLTAATEPRTRLNVSLNSKKLKNTKADGSGRFRLDLYAIEERNSLRMLATDRAGNHSFIRIPVVVDTSPPRLMKLIPPAGGTLNEIKPKLTVVLGETESEVKSVKLKVDGREVRAKKLKGSKRFVYRSGVLPDGKHKAYLEARDAADNVIVKKWSFNVDSTRILIVKNRFKLYLYKHGKVFKTYPVAVGQPGYPTPSGDWRIVNKRYMPTWINPHLPWSASMPHEIGPGPSNPLGTRAMDLSASGIRIHGTPASWSIGSPASHGCIRMYLSDAEEIFDLVAVGTPVDIVD